MEKTYLASDVCKITGAERRTIQTWVDGGFLSPSVEKAEGPGTRNRWSRGDIIDLVIFKELLEHGFSREEASAFVKEKEIVHLSGQAGPRLDDRDSLEWEEMIGLEIFAVQLKMVDGVRNLLIEAVNGDLFKALDWVKTGVLAVKAVNVTEIKKATMALL